MRSTGDLPGSGGRLEERTEDFFVDESLPYAPSGEGGHLFLRVEKRGLTTPDAVRSLAAALDAPARDAGYAGMKDRYAVATQWVSLPWSADRSLPEPGPVSGAPGLRLLEVARHAHKLKTGHVAANRFRVRLREVSPGGTEHARAVAARIAMDGCPNRFGPQRFGRDGDNVERGLRVLREGQGPRDRRTKRLLLSSVQSWLFNLWLDARLERQIWRDALLGDVMHKHATGGSFVCDAPELDRPRIIRGEISPTGPMFGRRMRAAEHEAGRVEAEVLERSGLDARDAGGLGPGTRRPARVIVEPVIEPDTHGYWVTMTLPSGAYATVILDELVKPTEGPLTRQRCR